MKGYPIYLKIHLCGFKHLLKDIMLNEFKLYAQQMKYEINNEYNVCLTIVNELYENKQSESESNFLLR